MAGRPHANTKGHRWMMSSITSERSVIMLNSQFYLLLPDQLNAIKNVTVTNFSYNKIWYWRRRMQNQGVKKLNVKWDKLIGLLVYPVVQV